MSKFLLYLILQISKALVNSKIKILIQKSFFLAFGPANIAAHSACGPASPPAVPSPQAEIVPTGPSSPRVGHVFAENTFSLSVHTFPSRSPLPRLSDNRAALVICLPHHAGRCRSLSSNPSGHPASPDLRPRDARQDNYPVP
jgi:hypothetical protein